MILSMSVGYRRPLIRGLRREERGKGRRTGSLVSLRPQIGDGVVDLLHLETVEAHDGSVGCRKEVLATRRKKSKEGRDRRTRQAPFATSQDPDSTSQRSTHPPASQLHRSAKEERRDSAP
jgi:hypothetical protein